MIMVISNDPVQNNLNKDHFSNYKEHGKVNLCFGFLLRFIGFSIFNDNESSMKKQEPKGLSIRVYICSSKL